MRLSLRDPAFLGSLTLYPAYVRDYLDRVTAADVAAGNSSGLERAVTDALSSFLQDLVAINYLGISNNVIAQSPSVIKASCIMAAARTRQGGLVPVVGTAPTAFGTAGGWDYNRRTGTQGNGTDNYLNSNRNNNADPQNSKHVAVSVSSPQAAGSGLYIGAGVFQAGTTGIGSDRTANTIFGRNNTGTFGSVAGVSGATGLVGSSRGAAANYVVRASGSNTTLTATSDVPLNGNIFVFARNDAGVPVNFTTARIAFYSIGENLDLALLDEREATLRNALAAAIP